MAELVQFAAQIEKVLFADKAFIFHQVMHKDTIEDFKLQYDELKSCNRINETISVKNNNCK